MLGVCPGFSLSVDPSVTDATFYLLTEKGVVTPKEKPLSFKKSLVLI